MTEILETDEYDVSACVNAVIEFDHYYNDDASADQGQVLVQLDGGSYDGLV